MYRFAPSPTGDMHIGNLRAAIFNYICAAQEKTGFFVRIEDTDIERNIKDKDKDILNILDIFGLKYEHLYYQTKNIKYHRQFAMQLVSQKKAFACFCTEDEIATKREAAKKAGIAYRYDNTCLNLSDEEILTNEKPFVIRIKQPENTITFEDDIKGMLSFEPKDIDSFVILRQNKYPMYNFACAIDDMLQGATHIIRGEDHVSNTPKQEHIRHSLGYDKTLKYAHLPIILNESGKKMSKRDDASSVQWLLNEGFLPDAIINYLVLLGNKTPTEIFVMKDATQWFDIKLVSKSPARFDIDKLRQINREHIRLMGNTKLANIFGHNDENIGNLAKLYTEEASTIKEIKQKIEAIFSKKNPPKDFESEFELIKGELLNTEIFETYDELKNFISQKTNLKGKNLFKPLRMLLSGAEHGPELAALYPIIKSYIKEIIK